MASKEYKVCSVGKQEETGFQKVDSYLGIEKEGSGHFQGIATYLGLEVKGPDHFQDSCLP